MSHHRDAWFQTKVSQNTRFFIRNAQFRSDSMIVATMMKKRPSSASCPLPTSVISHGAVSPLLWKMLHDVWHVPPLPPPNQCNLASRCFSSLVEDAACMARSSSASCPLPTIAISYHAVSPLSCKLLHVWHVPFYRIIVLTTSTALSIALVPTSWSCSSFLSTVLSVVFSWLILAPLVAFHRDTIAMVYLFLASSSSSVVDFSVGVPNDLKIKRSCGSAHGSYIYIHVRIIV